MSLILNVVILNMQQANKYENLMYLSKCRFFNSSVLTVKSDVYSFGIVLLEIITGLPPITQDDCHLLDHVRHKLQRQDKIQQGRAYCGFCRLPSTGQMRHDCTRFLRLSCSALGASLDEDICAR